MIARNTVLAFTLAGMIAIPGAIHAQSNRPNAGIDERSTNKATYSDRSLDVAESEEGHGAHGLEGSWAITVSPVTPPGVPPPPSFRAYGTFSRGGAFIGSDRRSPFGSPQHGAWAHTGGNEFVYAFIQDLFDVVGNFQGTVKVRAKITIVGEDEFVGVSSVERSDAAGNILVSRCGSGTIRGERITIESLLPQCEGIVPPG